MAYVTPGTVAAGDVATAAAWNVLVGNDVAFSPIAGAWTTFTPTLVPGWAATFTFPYAKYMQVGKTVAFMIHGVWSAVGAGSGLQINYPVTAASIYSAAGLSAKLLDGGVANYAANVAYGSTAYFSVDFIVTSAASATSGALSNSAPFTWGANDLFYVGGVYEAA
jgi:hypothetical protein